MNRPWMPLNIADYLRDTSHLMALESGAYLHLIMAYWVGGKLPNNDRQLATIAKLTLREWNLCKETLAAFFGPGWASHKRIDAELAKVASISNKRRSSAEQRKYRPLSNANQPPNQKPIKDQSNDYTLNISTEEQSKKEEESAAIAADPRTALFDRGLKTLAKMTGKTPDSCRSLVGKWLKSVNDEAIHVLGAIDDAERNRVADPVAWINKSLQPRNQHGQNNVLAAADQLVQRIREFDAPAPDQQRSIRGGTGALAVRAISKG